MKILTYDVVLEAVEKQCEAAGKTTTLDVKEALRRDDYWATQDAVSLLMAQQFVDGHLERDIAPGWQNVAPIPYNEYWIANDQNVAVDDEEEEDLGDSHDVVIAANPEPGDWFLFAYINTSSNPQVHVKGTVDRNSARAWYERECKDAGLNVPYAMVACSKVK